MSKPGELSDQSPGQSIVTPESPLVGPSCGVEPPVKEFCVTHVQTIWKQFGSTGYAYTSVKIGDRETQFLLMLESGPDACIYHIEVFIFSWGYP